MLPGRGHLQHLEPDCAKCKLCSSKTPSAARPYVRADISRRVGLIHLIRAKALFVDNTCYPQNMRNRCETVILLSQSQGEKRHGDDLHSVHRGEQEPTISVRNARSWASVAC